MAFSFAGASGAASGDMSGSFPGPVVGRSTSATWGVFSVTPVARPAAYTLTFADAGSRTLPAATAVAVATTAAVNIPATALYALSQAQVDGLVAGVNALIVDVGAAKQTLKQVISDLKLQGHLQ